MQMIKQLNAAIEYIENNLCAELDLERAAAIACITPDSLLRFFSYMTGMTLAEYIRRRRLTRVGEELRNTSAPIIELALKYGYENAASFSRAFTRQHGITPSAFRKSGGTLKIIPPASFRIVIKGAKEMDFRIITLPDTEVYGVSKPYDDQVYTNREELRNPMWSENLEDVPGQICKGHWNDADSGHYDGIWYGIWQDGRYMIAREAKDVRNFDIEHRIIPGGMYAAFTTEKGTLAWEEFPKLFELIFESWLPTSEYKLKSDLAIEVLHLWADYDLRKKNKYYEVWIPIEKK